MSCSKVLNDLIKNMDRTYCTRCQKKFKKGDRVLNSPLVSYCKKCYFKELISVGYGNDSSSIYKGGQNE